MRHVTYRFATGLIFLGGLWLSGCRVGPDYQEPSPALPEGWSQQAQPPVVSEETLKAWWTALQDPALDELIERARLGNPDLEESIYRIEESRALRDYAAGRNYPSADFVGSYTRSRDSQNTAFSFPGMDTEHGLYSTGFDAAWELDLFGGVRRSVESAQAQLEASVEDSRAIRVSLYAEVAATYIELRTARMRIHYAEENIQAQKETLVLVESRFKAGIAPELDVAQARQNLADTEADLPLIRLAEQRAISRLAVLLGEYPQDFSLPTEGFGSSPLPALSELPTGLPADLLRRRPDIRWAERQLAAQTARIGEATAELYPAFSLAGSFRLEAEYFSDLGHNSSKSTAYGPGLRWRVFEGGRLRSLVRAEEARTRQALVRYERTVLSAVEEVENALAAYVQESLREEALARAAGASEDTVRLVQTLYRSGLTDFQNVLDAQRTLFRLQDRLAASRGTVVVDLIRVYKALGGGWDPQAEDTKQAAEKTEGSKPSASNS
jgi:NodT family efflux transporter outer membrane factor (OMF) lipoprotein